MPASVGYVQGMNYVVGVVLQTFSYDEETTFWFLIQLFNRQNLVEIYDVNSNKYKLLTYQTEALLGKHSPKLTRHLQKLGFDTSIYCVKWFFSCFAIDLPVDYIMHVLDFYQYE